MRAVDTNVLVRLIIRDDEQQYQSALAFVEAGAWVSHLVLVETVGVLAKGYGLRSDDLADAVKLVLTNENLIIQDAETVVEALELFRSRSGLGFMDCMMFHSARKAGHLPLGTFDRVLSRVEGTQRL